MSRACFSCFWFVYDHFHVLYVIYNSWWKSMLHIKQRLKAKGMRIMKFPNKHSYSILQTFFRAKFFRFCSSASLQVRQAQAIKPILKPSLLKYRKVASSRLSWLVAHPRIFRLFMKGNFDAYVLWPLDKMVQNWIVDRSTACDFTVCMS